MQKSDNEEQAAFTRKTKADGGTRIHSVKKHSKFSKRKSKLKKEDESSVKTDDQSQDKKKASYTNDEFIIAGQYLLVKMLGYGAFGEIHLAHDLYSEQLRAIKFEVASQKNPQLKHEYNILEQLNAKEESIQGIPKVYGFDRLENKFNYMIMDLLGPSLSDLFLFQEKVFSLETVLVVGIQMLSRIEYIHDKGYIHRDIKPENFVIGLNEKCNTIHIIDFGLSKRFKEKNSGQHIPYRENRHLVGTVRYASINAHLGIEQSRRDDIESIGYVLVYFLLGRLPWQSKQDKTKPPVNKIMEKKLNTPPEILCKKIDIEFSYYFHYCQQLKFDDRPDYNHLKSLFWNLLCTKITIENEFTFDWLEEAKEDTVIKKDDDTVKNQYMSLEFKNFEMKQKSSLFNYLNNQVVQERDEENSQDNLHKNTQEINAEDPKSKESGKFVKEAKCIPTQEENENDSIKIKDDSKAENIIQLKQNNAPSSSFSEENESDFDEDGAEDKRILSKTKKEDIELTNPQNTQDKNAIALKIEKRK